MIKTNKQVEEIFRSYKKEGFAAIKTNKRWHFRQIWPQKDGRFVVTFDNLDYNFIWEADKAVDIKITKVHDRAEKVEVEKVEDEKIVDKAEKIIKEIKTPSGKVQHSSYEKIKICVQFDIPIYLHGPAGSGKNHTLEQIAKDLGLDFYFTNSVQQEYKITGFIDAGGEYHETEFFKAFTKGGLFFLDELDASIPEILVLLNAAVANRYFEFPTGRVTAHKDFRVVAAGNTTGDGADETYTGRLVIDGSTLDRFGYIEFNYEYSIELHIAKGDKSLVDFIRSIRKQAEENGIRATFSYRCIMMVTTLKGNLPLEEILQMAVFKGLNKDTINTFRFYEESEYTKALKKMQRGA